jgi:hypothetical protein
MSTRNVERELATLLCRHAEDAMNSTDTQAERERLYDVLENEPRATRTPLLVAAAAAALAAVGTIAVWTSLPDHRVVSPAPPAPSTDAVREADAEALADLFMVAYGERDLAVVNAITRVGAWGDVARDDFDAELATVEGWHATYFPEPCAATVATNVAVVVECEAGLQIMGSEETGVGPFLGNVFTFVVRDGQIIEAGNEHPHTTNGLGDHITEVTDWVLNHASPVDRAILDSEVGDLTDSDVERWVDLWSQGIDAYVASHPSEGNG